MKNLRPVSNTYTLYMLRYKDVYIDSAFLEFRLPLPMKLLTVSLKPVEGSYHVNGYQQLLSDPKIQMWCEMIRGRTLK